MALPLLSSAAGTGRPKAGDDVPVCPLVGILDFARFRNPAFDWTADAAFKARYEELVAAGNRDPLLDPASWAEPLRAALLFPSVGFVN
ncbi:MAG: hypothetical protein HY905_13335 [Deltaproteobacteria bacterium]|nr:hypothetical protein [Deltaproteobacteria bacterium]